MDTELKMPWFHMADPRADAEVTLRDMLSHRTGLKAKADLAAEPGVLSREEFVRAATAAKPTAPFRTAFQYSNAMYSAAGEVLGSAALADERLPSVQALLSLMTEAMGGEDVLRRHQTLEIQAHKTYENQGIHAALTVRAKAPASRVEEEVWTAAGREIARLRFYFDGRHGGQETTFGQDALNDDAANDRARRDDDLHPLLHLADLYQEVRVDSKATVGAEEAFVMTLVPKTGPKVLLYVATATGLILKRETEGETIVFSDYQRVDGERIPFRSTISDALGETTVEVEQARYGVPIEDTAFAPAKSQAPNR
jgi:beta-lactamase family protein